MQPIQRTRFTSRLHLAHWKPLLRNYLVSTTNYEKITPPTKESGGKKISKTNIVIAASPVPFAVVSLAFEYSSSNLKIPNELAFFHREM